MKCDYNGNLEYEERIAIVSKEITDYYPFISKSESILIASLCPIISTDNYIINLIKRLYYIMYVNHKYDEIIYKDILSIDNDEEVVKNIKIVMNRYINKKQEYPKYYEIFAD